MTTKELIEKLNELDFVGRIIDEAVYVEVLNISGNCIAIADKRSMYDMNTDIGHFDDLKTTEKQQLFDLLSEYAKTPIEDREEKTLYTATSKIDPSRSLCRVDEDGYRIRIIGFDVPDEITTEFTEEELKNVKGINVLDSNEWWIERVE